MTSVSKTCLVPSEPVIEGSEDEDLDGSIRLLLKGICSERKGDGQSEETQIKRSKTTASKSISTSSGFQVRISWDGAGKKGKREEMGAHAKMKILRKCLKWEQLTRRGRYKEK